MTVRPNRVLPYGPRAVLAEYDSLAEVMAAATGMRAAVASGAGVGVVDIVPAARTVLVTGEGLDVDALVAFAESPSPVSIESASAPPSVEIEVRYDGEDLTEVAARCAMSVDELVGTHSAATYTVAFCGFLPGFAYLTGLDPRLHLPRRPSPRQRVPAGSVAIAGEFSAVYPSASPGGWHLLGTTDAVMWDEERTEPALLPPGTRVRFRPA